MLTCFKWKRPVTHVPISSLVEVSQDAFVVIKQLGCKSLDAGPRTVSA